jgi:ParB/RepB/Spo0J family partition protein
MTGDAAVTPIPLVDIMPGDNDRTRFQHQALRELADNIKDHGLAQPITLRLVGQGYQIVAGERRFRAFKLLEKEQPNRWTAIPAIIRDYTDEQADAIMLAENLHRADLDPIDEALAYQKRIDRYGWTITELAKRANVTSGRVSSRLKLLKLIPEVQHLVKFGNMPLGHAQAMSSLNKNFQFVALRAITGKNLSIEEFKAVCSELLRRQSQASMWDLSVFEKVPDEKIAEKVMEKEPIVSSFHFSVGDVTIGMAIEHMSDTSVTLTDEKCAAIRKILFD